MKCGDCGQEGFETIKDIKDHKATCPARIQTTTATDEPAPKEEKATHGWTDKTLIPTHLLPGECRVLGKGKTLALTVTGYLTEDGFVVESARYNR